MAEDQERAIQNYMEGILRAQSRRSGGLTSDDLRAIARDAGMSDEDLAFAEQIRTDALNRGEGFLRYENWDGAIDELRQAAALAPSDPRTLKGLATAYWRRSVRDKSEEDAKMAKGYAERVLQVDPTNDAALKIVSDAEKKARGIVDPTPRSKSGSSTPAAIKVVIAVVASVVFLIIGVAVIIFMAARKSNDTPTITSTSQTPSTRSVPAPDPEEAEKPEDDIISEPTSFAKTLLAFGKEGIGPGMFKDARSIGVDGEGRMYVGEYQGGRIQVFDANGKYLTQWNIGPKNILRGMGVDRQGNVYTAFGGKIHKHEGMTGKELAVIGDVDGADDVAVGDDGSIVVSAFDSKDPIYHFGSDGKLIKKIDGTFSVVNDHSEMDSRVAIDGEGNIYTLGSFNSAILKYNSAGKFVTQFGSRGNEPGQFSAPHSIAVDGQGRVYVGDIWGLEVYAPDGRFITQVRVRPNTFDLDFDDAGNIYIAGRDKVVKLAITG